jgi:hypothetical protein
VRGREKKISGFRKKWKEEKERLSGRALFLPLARLQIRAAEKGKNGVFDEKA